MPFADDGRYMSHEEYNNHKIEQLCCERGDKLERVGELVGELLNQLEYIKLHADTPTGMEIHQILMDMRFIVQS